jgi:thiol:disulfide interchange protein DsbA
MNRNRKSPRKSLAIAIAIVLAAVLSAALWLPKAASAQEVGAGQGQAQAPHQDHGQPPRLTGPAEGLPPPSEDNGDLVAILRPKRLDESDDKIEVAYFFWYGCPSCYKTDAATSMFLSSLPDDVRVVRLHAMFDEPPFWRQHGRLFYVLDELGAEKNLHQTIFETVQSRTPSSSGHYTQGLLTPESQETFAAAHGVSRAAFKAAYDSPAVLGRIERVISFMDNAGLRGVPALVINGRYQFSIFAPPGFYQQAERLINLERERLAAEKAAPAEAAE